MSYSAPALSVLTSIRVNIARCANHEYFKETIIRNLVLRNRIEKSREAVLEGARQGAAVRHVTGNDKDYLRKIPRVVW